MSVPPSQPHPWKDAQGRDITCHGKLQALQDGLADAERACRDALDDALLMGCSHESAIQALRHMFDNLTPTVKERT